MPEQYRLHQIPTSLSLPVLVRIHLHPILNQSTSGFILSLRHPNRATAFIHSPCTLRNMCYSQVLYLLTLLTTVKLHPCLIQDGGLSSPVWTAVVPRGTDGRVSTCHRMALSTAGQSSFGRHNLLIGQFTLGSQRANKRNGQLRV